jgi:hypothetical protein
MSVDVYIKPMGLEVFVFITRNFILSKNYKKRILWCRASSETDAICLQWCVTRKSIAYNICLFQKHQKAAYERDTQALSLSKTTCNDRMNSLSVLVSHSLTQQDFELFIFRKSFLLPIMTYVQSSSVFLEACLFKLTWWTLFNMPCCRWSSHKWLLEFWMTYLWEALVYKVRIWQPFALRIHNVGFSKINIFTVRFLLLASISKNAIIKISWARKSRLLCRLQLWDTQKSLRCPCPKKVVRNDNEGACGTWVYNRHRISALDLFLTQNL